MFRGHRSGDTGELEPVPAEVPNAHPQRPDRPRGRPLRPAPAAPLRLAQAARRAGRRRRPGLGGRRAAYAWSQRPVLRLRPRRPGDDLPRRRREPARRHPAAAPTSSRSIELATLSDYDARPGPRRASRPTAWTTPAACRRRRRLPRPTRPAPRPPATDCAADPDEPGPQLPRLRAPASPGCGALPADPRARRRHRRLRRGRPRRRGRRPGRHHRVRRLAGRC